MVEPEQGNVTRQYVVNVGGTYARQMASWSEYDLPTTSMTHHYPITDTVPELQHLDIELPVLCDDRLVSGYITMEQKSGLIGIYENANPNTVREKHCPRDAEQDLFEPGYDRIIYHGREKALDRMPVLAEMGIKRAVHGAISHPPDGNPRIGRARWMVYDAAAISMREFDRHRFGAYADQGFQTTKAKRDCPLRHEPSLPHFNRLGRAR